MYTDDELSLYSDDDVYGAETNENATSQPIKASLADFLVNTQRHQKRSKRYVYS